MILFKTHFLLFSGFSVFTLLGCADVQFKPNFFSPENQLFLNGKFSLIEEQQTYVVQESGWGSLIERASEMIAFPFAMIQSGNSIESRYDENLLKREGLPKREENEISAKHLLKSDDPEVRGIGVKLTENLPAILERLDDTNSFTRILAVKKLRSIPLSSEDFLRLEQKIRLDPDEHVRCEAILSLKNQPQFRLALPALVLCSQEESDLIRKRVMEILVLYPYRESIPLLLKGLGDSVFFVREAAMATLHELQTREKNVLTDFFGYSPSAPEPQRRASLERLSEWWRERS